MKLAVFGSRSITNKEEIISYLDIYLAENEVSTVLVGGAAGVQDITREYLAPPHSKPWNIDVITFKPWHLIDTKLEFATKLFFMRNRQIVDNSQRVLAFVKIGEEDSEVDKAIEFARKRGKQVDVIEIV